MIETEKKTSKNQTSVYVRHWKPDEYELGELREEIVEGNSYEQLINHVSLKKHLKFNFNYLIFCLF